MQAIAVLPATGVERVRRGLAAGGDEFRHHRLAAVELAAGNGDDRTSTRQAARDFAAKAAAAAGDDGDFSAEIDGDQGLRSFKVDRKSVVEGKSVSVRVELGGGRVIKKKTSNQKKRRGNREKKRVTQ